MLVLAVTLTGFGVWHFTAAIPAPSINSICEPGGCTEVPCSYTVYADGSTYLAKNCKTGANDYSGTVATTVVQNALNALTAGRTWQEKVVLKDTISFTASVLQPSYSIIEIQGKVTETTGSNLAAIFENADYNTGTLDQYLTITGAVSATGGEIDGNGSGQSSGNGMAIDWFGNVKYSKLSYLYVHNTRGFALDIRSAGGGIPDHVTVAFNRFLGPQTGPVGDLVGGDSTQHTLFLNNIIASSNQNGLTWLRCSYDWFQNNRFTGNSNNGMEIQGCVHMHFSDNIYDTNTGSGLIIDPYDPTTTLPSDITVTNNQFFSNTLQGLFTSTGSTTGSFIRFLITGNQAYSNQQSGFRLGSLGNSTISNNLLFNNNQGARTNDWEKSGLFLQNSASRPCNFLIVANNNVFDDQAVHTQANGIFVYDPAPCTNSLFEGNSVYGNTVVNFHFGGVGTNIAKNNQGYNPVGNLSNFINGGNIGVCGTGSTVVSATLYKLCGTDLVWGCTGGTVSAIVEKDPAGTQIFSVANCAALPATDVYTPVGYSITFTFTVAPTFLFFAN